MGSKDERKEYVEFMCDVKNSHACDRCPENREFGSWQDRLPCGQFRCWVDIHCKNKETKDLNSF